MSIIGRSIDRYQIIEEIGRGGTATVFKCFDTRLQREVAIKLIQTNNIPPVQLEKLAKRFEREALAQAKFEHPNIIPVYDYGEYNGIPYLVMAYQSGGTFQDLRKPLAYQEAARLLAPIADALSYAHQRGVIHRDVKPSNIMLSESGIPILMDFGIAKLLSDIDEMAITGTGIGIGTPKYMAPEQWQGIVVESTDIYSLGVVFYELVTGKTPFTADSPAALLLKQANEPVPRPSEVVSEIPEFVDEIIVKALAKKTGDRYKTAQEFAEVLYKISTDGTKKSQVINPVQKNTSTKVAKKSKSKKTAHSFAETLVFQGRLGGKTENIDDKANKDILKNWWLELIILGFLFFLFIQLFLERYFNITISKSIIELEIIVIFSLVSIDIFKFLIPIISSLLSPNKEKVQEISNDSLLERTEEIKPVLGNDLTINIMSHLDPKKKDSILTLIGRDQELRIKDIIVHYGGGRYLLRGYGRFGASAIINQIIEYAKADLAEFSPNKEGEVLAIRLEFFDKESDAVFSALVREFRLEAIRGKYSKSLTTQIEQLDKKRIADVIKSSEERSFSIKAAPVPGIETSFSRKMGAEPLEKKKKISDYELIDIVTKFLDRSEKLPNGFLESFINRLVNDNKKPTRVIFVVDKVKTENSIRHLQNLRLFDDSRVSFFLLTKQEDYLQWSDETKRLIDDLGFRSHYVPCLWEHDTEFISTMVNDFDIKGSGEERRDNFISHIAFVTRGAPGEVVRELLSPKYTDYRLKMPLLRLDKIRDEDLIRYNSQRQTLLEMNWDRILENHFISKEEKDQAIIGVYRLMDWIHTQRGFSIDSLLEQARNDTNLISPSGYLQEKVCMNLVDVLVKSEYLDEISTGIYRVKDVEIARGDLSKYTKNF